MTIIKYHTFEEAQKSHWNFKPDPQYYQQLREIFRFFSGLSARQKYPQGIFRYASFDDAGGQDLAWKVMTPSGDYLSGAKKVGTPNRQRVFKKSQNFQEAEEWDIQQHIRMSPAERQEIARILRQRIYGNKVSDIREFYKK